MKKILILGVASVQADAIKTLNRLGYETHALAMKKDGPGADLADSFKEINILDIEKVTEYVKENKIDVVYSVGSDLAIPVASEISENLKLPYFVTSETAKICNKKDKMREFLGNNFEGNVNYQILKAKSESIKLDFPFIMKPTDSQGQRGVNLIHTQEQFESLFNETQGYSRDKLVIIEQYIDGPEVSVNGYMEDGKITFLEVSDRETWEKYTGLIRKHVVPSEKITPDIKNKLISIIENACLKLNINNGPVYVQMKIEDNSPYIIEITPRLDGCHMWKLLKYATEFDILESSLYHLIENKNPNLSVETNVRKYELEFACQKPNTNAVYTDYKENEENSEEYYYYYCEGDLIRPVNGKYEKIGYFVNNKEAQI
ncbi:ATP-grasp domain-containing protein [Vagococcus hydrophili]|nr:ATP-grasp domain-containing protein [Vagococcus hydrophili]